MLNKFLTGSIITIVLFLVISSGCKEFTDSTTNTLLTSTEKKSNSVINPIQGEGKINIQSPIPVEKEKNRSWLYQLQNLDVDKILSVDFSLVVMDYTKNGRDENIYSKEEIDKIKNKDIIPISYISIGEASFFRNYWKEEWAEYNFVDGDKKSIKKIPGSAPGWLGKIPNPNWPESVKVRYWDTEWQENYIKKTLNKITEAGFKGVYLDIIDAFEYWGNEKNYENGKESKLASDPVDEEDSAERMIKFVKMIANYCRQKNPDFMIFPQNGEWILEYDKDQSYLNIVNGIGVEALWYNKDKKNSDEFINSRLKYLRKFIQNKKIVLSVDYVDDKTGYDEENKKRIDEYINNCKKEGFRYYIGLDDRALDALNIIKGIQP